MFAALPDPNSFASIGWLVVCLAGLIAIINGALSLVDRFKVTPPPAETYATKVEVATLRGELSADVDSLEAKLDDLRSQAVRDKGELMTAGEQRASRIHQRIEDSMGDVNGRIDNMEKELREMPHQMVALLKNTGGLR